MRLRLYNLRVKLGPVDLAALAAERLLVQPADLGEISVVKSSVDGRKRVPVQVWTLDVEIDSGDRILQRFKGDPGVVQAPPPKQDRWAGPQKLLGRRPVVVGAGPAGILCAHALSAKGYRPLLVDRGKPVKPRWKDVNAYWRHGELNPNSNVVFGDGGAGTFSDGKLYTRRNDSRNQDILKFFARLADAPDILTAGKPHLGTNRLSRALLAMHQELADQGVTLEFESSLEDLVIQDGRIQAAVINGEKVPTDAVFLATGHSARDVYRMLHRLGVAMEARPIAVGARAEHPQQMIDISQWGISEDSLGAADYMLSYNHKSTGRAGYTFCMCPGGEVVAAGTEQDGLTVNGMSYSHRAGGFGNAAVVVTVDLKDYGSNHPLAGIEFQRDLEVRAYELGGGGHVAPAQLIPDFLNGKKTESVPATSYRRGVRGADLTSILPEDIVHVMSRSLNHFSRRVEGYTGREGVLIGLETRTTSPVRIVRSPEAYESVNVAGLYPLGEGAGFAGGIMSSASDGLRAVERVAEYTGGKAK